MDAQMMSDRLLVLNDSDATCDRCGRDPRETPATEAAFLAPDTRWYVDLILRPSQHGPEQSVEMLCPVCFTGEEEG